MRELGFPPSRPGFRVRPPNQPTTLPQFHKSSMEAEEAGPQGDRLGTGRDVTERYASHRRVGLNFPAFSPKGEASDLPSVLPTISNSLLLAPSQRKFRSFQGEQDGNEGRGPVKGRES